MTAWLVLVYFMSRQQKLMRRGKKTGNALIECDVLQSALKVDIRTECRPAAAHFSSFIYSSVDAEISSETGNPVKAASLYACHGQGTN